MKKQLTIFIILLLIAATNISAKKATVINQANGLPLVGVEVKISDQTYISDRNGNLPDGVLSDKAITTYNGIFLNSSTDDSTIIIDFPFTLNKPKKLDKIGGKLLDESESEVTVKPIVLSKDGFSYKTKSDRNGDYNFDYLAEGDWSITIEEDKKYQGYYEKIAVDSVAIDTNKHNIVLKEHPPKYGSFEATIFLEDNLPAVGASVRLLGTTMVASVNVNGVGTISDIEAGTYIIKVSSLALDPLLDTIKIEIGKTLKKMYRFEQLITSSHIEVLALSSDGKIVWTDETPTQVFEFDSGNQFTAGFGGNGTVIKDGEIMTADLSDPAGGDLNGTMPDPLIAKSVVNKTQVGSVSKFSSSSLQRTASGGVSSVVTQSSGVSKSGLGIESGVQVKLNGSASKV